MSGGEKVQHKITNKCRGHKERLVKMVHKQKNIHKMFQKIFHNHRVKAQRSSRRNKLSLRNLRSLQKYKRLHYKKEMVV